MTPQERELVTQLFDRLASLESAPRDPEAEKAIIDGLRRAPNAAYALVQTTLLQDEALRRADERIQALEAQLGGAPAGRPSGGFLDSMREAFLGPREAPRAGSVPSIRPAPPTAPDPRAQDPRDQAAYAPGAPPGAPLRQGPSFGGGSFLGTAASTAAGVIGGSLLLDGIRSMMGEHHSSFGVTDPAYGASAPPGSDSSASGDLGREAGVDDVGRDQHAGADSGSGLFDHGTDTDTADNQADQDADDQADQDDVGSFDDSGSDFGGGGDYNDA
jgi:hypothetical protein